MNHLLTYTISDEGIATITIDQKNNPTNLFSMEFIQAYQEASSEARAAMETARAALAIPLYGPSLQVERWLSG